MRRFSQRNSLVTLSDINITPLLDLAFVLLIIFIITTPLLEQSLTLNLPEGGQPDRLPTKEDVRFVEINPQGAYLLDGVPVVLAQMESELVRAYRGNPNLVVSIRADKSSPLDFLAQVLDRCERNGITRIAISTEPHRD